MFTETVRVTDQLAARQLLTHGVKVLSTPEMVRLMERCVVNGLQPYLGPDESAVGVRVDIRHLAATPASMDVTVSCRLLSIDRRRLRFSFEVRDRIEKVGEGWYESFVLERSRQRERLAAKLAQAEPGAPP